MLTGDAIGTKHHYVSVLWGDAVAQRYGVTLWVNPMEKHYEVTSYGAVLWGDIMERCYGAEPGGDAMVLCSRVTQWGSTI